jgi:hypothetical protein
VNHQREFLYKVGSSSVYRFKDKRLGYRYVLTDGVKERLFDTEPELQEYHQRTSRGLPSLGDFPLR